MSSAAPRKAGEADLLPCRQRGGGDFSNTGTLSPSLRLPFALEEVDRYTDIQVGRHLIKKNENKKQYAFNYTQSNERKMLD